MSRIGKQPIEIPDGVNVAVDPGRVTVNGPLGELTQNVPATQIPKVQGGMGTAIVSTSSGVMTGHQARQAGVGGEVVAHVW
jgi:ribosomal protein L6P/L9E